MAPVHHAGHDEPIDISQNFFERFAFFRRSRRKLRTNGAGLVVRRNAQRSYILPKIRDPIHKFMKLFPKNPRWRVTKLIQFAAQMFLSIFHSLG